MRIGDVRKKLFNDFGIDISIERLRRYEEEDLFKCQRGKTSNFRTYTEDDYTDIKRIVSFITLGAPIKIIKENNKEELVKVVYTTTKMLEFLKNM